MALVPATLVVSLTDLFTNHPADELSARTNFASAISDYISTVTPAIVPGTAEVAEQSMIVALIGWSELDAAFSLIPVAFTAWAATIGAGMAPAFVATPPLAPINISSLPREQTNAAIAAVAWSNLIDTWVRTGMAVPSGGGPSVPWS